MADIRDVLNARAEADKARRVLAPPEPGGGDMVIKSEGILLCEAAEAICAELRALALTIDHHAGLSHGGRP